MCSRAVAASDHRRRVISHHLSRTARVTGRKGAGWVHNNSTLRHPRTLDKSYSFLSFFLCRIRLHTHMSICRTKRPSRKYVVYIMKCTCCLKGIFCFSVARPPKYCKVHIYVHIYCTNISLRVNYVSFMCHHDVMKPY